MDQDPVELTEKIMNLLTDMVCLVDAEGRYVFLNAACEKLLGYSPDELIGREMIDLVHPDDVERTLDAARDVMHGKPRANFENRYIRKDGSIAEIMWSARWWEDDELRLAVARDVTELKRATRRQEAMYRISETAQSAEGMEALYSRVHDFICKLLPADRFFVALHDPMRDQLSFPFFFDGEERRQEDLPLREDGLLARVIREGRGMLANTGQSVCPVTEPGTGRDDNDWLGVPLMSPSGLLGAVVVQARPGAPCYRDEDLALLQFVATQVGSAIERMQEEERLFRMAHYDALTDLPNRTLFNDRVSMALNRAQRDQENLAVLYLDLRDFKNLNDSVGHAAGDEMLRETAQRLTSCLRDSDTVCRIGGDEFTVLVNNIHDPGDVDVISDKLRAAVSAPIELEGETFSLPVDIGAAVYPEDGEDVDTLLRQADANMYRSKRNDASGERTGDRTHCP